VNCLEVSSDLLSSSKNFIDDDNAVLIKRLESYHENEIWSICYDSFGIEAKVNCCSLVALTEIMCSIDFDARAKFWKLKERA
jgi:hypothetical protein